MTLFSYRRLAICTLLASPVLACKGHGPQNSRVASASICADESNCSDVTTQLLQIALELNAGATNYAVAIGIESNASNGAEMALDGPLQGVVRPTIQDLQRELAERQAQLLPGLADQIEGDADSFAERRALSVALIKLGEVMSRRIIDGEAERAALAEVSKALEKIQALRLASSQPVRGNIISSGLFHVCALSPTGVVCWGDDKWGQVSKIPSLKKPVAVAAGGYHSCAIDQSGVKCWGQDRYGVVSKVPMLNKPTALVVGDSHACAVDQSGLHCWGHDEFGQVSQPPKLTKLRAFTSGGHHTCLIEQDKLSCWGYDEFGQVSRIPSLEKPTAVATNGAYTCALDQTGVKCWGRNSGGILKVPPLTKPVVLSGGLDHACVIDQGAVKCWGDNKHGQTSKIPTLDNPFAISTGGGHTCAVDRAGIKCWGHDGFGTVTNTPNLKFESKINQEGAVGKL